MRAADLYALPELRDHCASALCNMITSSNMAAIARVATQLKSTNLANRVKEYMHSNIDIAGMFDALIQSQGGADFGESMSSNSSSSSSSASSHASLDT
jgi:hypothetical protein